MSDLDKAIRADLTERARDVAPYAADRSMVTYADAIRSVLDLHTHSDVGGLRITTGPMRQCAACGLVSRGQWCDTVNAIADDLGVSGEDRSEPTPAPREPRVWVEGDPAPTDANRFRDHEDDEWSIHFIGQDGEPWLHLPDGASFPWLAVLKHCGPLTEVLPAAVTLEGTP